MFVNFLPTALVVLALWALVAHNKDRRLPNEREYMKTSALNYKTASRT